ncbi:MAG: dimethylsulfonioproprionate lyase family protein [Paracoccaceae bacterium]
MPDSSLALLMAEASAYLAPLTGPGAGELRRLLARRSPATIRPAAHHPPIVADHLDTALAALTATHPALSASIATAAPHLGWRLYDSYPPEEIGPAFARGHAYCPLIGPDAPIRNRMPNSASSSSRPMSSTATTATPRPSFTCPHRPAWLALRPRPPPDRETRASPRLERSQPPPPYKGRPDTLPWLLRLDGRHRPTGPGPARQRLAHA